MLMKGKTSGVPVDVRPGDVFCSANPWAVGRLIQAAERFWSRDNHVEYGHAGIITGASGETLEALWTVKHSTLSAYSGKPVLIARPLARLDRSVTLNMDMAINRTEEEHLRQGYPIWRLVFHLIPPLAKYVASKKFLVCSELVAKYLFYIGARHGQYMGTNPDTLADEWDKWRNFEVIFKGVWP